MKKLTRLGLLLSFLSLQLILFGKAFASEVPHVRGEMIIKLKFGADSKTAFKRFQSIGVTYDRAIKLTYATLYVVKFDASQNFISTMGILSEDPSVEYAEPNYIYSLIEPVEPKTVKSLLGPLEEDEELNYTPNDPKFRDLWGLHNTGRNARGAASVAGADINALKAWEVGKGSRNVKIAVIDTGIDYRHPDLKDQIWVNEAELNGEKGVDDDENGYVDDIHGYDFANNDGDPLDGNSHGTHCAGTIGATHNNNTGVAGVMADVTLIPVKFLTDSGSGTTENAIRAIDYATKLNVDIMSNSWGGGGFSEALKEAIANASKEGIVFTAAAGNSGSNNDSRPHYPSNYKIKNVISVAASTSDDSLASFSCYGRKTVHIAAPGKNILSTTKSNGYKSLSGTSMATPHVSGAIGLLLAQEGRISHEEMKERLMATSVPIPTLRGKVMAGSGRLDAFNLLTNTRPERNEPKPGDWESVAVEKFESDHPYRNNEKLEKTFSFPGAKFIRVKVKRFELEKNYDFLVVSGKGRTVEKITEKGTDYSSQYVTGDSIKVEFRSDRSINKWGFVIEEIEVVKKK
ncbi:S8 family serine peptidase [Bacteriovoracales bacterium]|nr:S8 family serine peptidase [Bacteriovoracales bacterium]